MPSNPFEKPLRFFREERFYPKIEGRVKPEERFYPKIEGRVKPEERFYPKSEGRLPSSETLITDAELHRTILRGMAEHRTGVKLARDIADATVKKMNQAGMVTLNLAIDTASIVPLFGLRSSLFERRTWQARGVVLNSYVWWDDKAMHYVVTNGVDGPVVAERLYMMDALTAAFKD